MENKELRAPYLLEYRDAFRFVPTTETAEDAMLDKLLCGAKAKDFFAILPSLSKLLKDD